MFGGMGLNYFDHIYSFCIDIGYHTNNHQIIWKCLKSFHCGGGVERELRVRHRHRPIQPIFNMMSQTFNMFSPLTQLCRRAMVIGEQMAIVQIVWPGLGQRLTPPTPPHNILGQILVCKPTLTPQEKISISGQGFSKPNYIRKLRTF